MDFQFSGKNGTIKCIALMIQGIDMLSFKSLDFKLEMTKLQNNFTFTTFKTLKIKKVKTAKFSKVNSQISKSDFMLTQCCLKAFFFPLSL